MQVASYVPTQGHNMHQQIPTQVDPAIGDSFRIDGKKMTVIAIDQGTAWLKDDCGAHCERSVQGLAYYGKYVVQPTELPGYPIAEMPGDGKFYLVSVDRLPLDPGLCRKANGALLIDGGGGHYGATHYHPFTLTYPVCG